MNRRHARSLMGLVIVSLAIGGFFVWNPGVLPSDNPADVARIDIRLDRFHSGVSFTVDPKDHPRVLALFADGQIDRSPAKWVTWGDITIVYKDGRQAPIRFFHTYQSKGAYQVNGFRYYRGASDAAFEQVIAESQKRGTPIVPPDE